MSPRCCDSWGAGRGAGRPVLIRAATRSSRTREAQKVLETDDISCCARAPAPGARSRRAAQSRSEDSASTPSRERVADIRTGSCFRSTELTACRKMLCRRQTTVIRTGSHPQLASVADVRSVMPCHTVTQRTLSSRSGWSGTDEMLRSRIRVYHPANARVLRSASSSARGYGRSLSLRNEVWPVE